MTGTPVPGRELDNRELDRAVAHLHRLRWITVAGLAVLIFAGLAVVAYAGWHGQASQDARLALQQQELHSGCALLRAEAQLPLPIASPRLVATIAIAARQEYAGRRCTPALPAMSAGLARLAAAYHIPVAGALGETCALVVHACA